MAGQVKLADLGRLLTGGLSNMHKSKFMQRAADVAGERIANAARKNAPFTDQTSMLRKSIAADDAEVSKDLIRVRVIANQQYAVYIEHGQAEGKAILARDGGSGSRAGDRKTRGTKKRKPSDPIPGEPTGARPFLRPALISESGQILKDFDKAVEKELKKRFKDVGRLIMGVIRHL